MLGSHLFNMAFYAFAIAALFSLFMRDRWPERLRFTLLVASSMIGAGIVVGWLMLIAR